MTATAPPRFDPERLRRARAYRAFSLRLMLGSTVVGIAVMVALYLGGAGIAARDAVRALPFGLDVYLVIAIFTVAGWLAQLPFSYLGWSRGRDEGLVVQPLGGAFADRVKGLALTLVLVGIPTTLWYEILGRPDWWVLTLGGTLALAALATLIGPALTSLFFKMEPLADTAVAQRVREVAERAGVRVSGVYRLGLGEKTTAANAVVLGIGPTKRIALGDTLLGPFPIDEIEAVVAHEVGHDVSGDPPRYVVAFGVAGGLALILLRVLVDAFTCGVQSMSPGAPLQPACGAGTLTPVWGTSDPASYPLVAAAFSVLAFIGRPALMAFTRWRESAADTFGARHTSAEAMARALVRLAEQNLADPEPPRWEEVFFYSHPSIGNRVRRLGLRWRDVAPADPTA